MTRNTRSLGRASKMPAYPLEVREELASSHIPVMVRTSRSPIKAAVPKAKGNQIRASQSESRLSQGANLAESRPKRFKSGPKTPRNVAKMMLLLLMWKEDTSDR